MMKKFIRIKHVAKGMAATLRGVECKFFIGKTKEKTGIKLGLYLGEIIENHLLLRPKSKVYITFDAKNNFRMKIKKCKTGEYGYTLEHQKLKKEDILSISFFWTICKIPLKWTLLPRYKVKCELHKDYIILDLNL